MDIFAEDIAYMPNRFRVIATIRDLAKEVPPDVQRTIRVTDSEEYVALNRDIEQTTGLLNENLEPKYYLFDKGGGEVGLADTDNWVVDPSKSTEY